MRGRQRLSLQVLFGFLFCAMQADSAPVARDSLRLRFIAAFGEEGDRPGQMRRPHAISNDGKGNLYVADTGNNRVQKFDRQGRFLSMIGGFGWANEQFHQPLDVCADNGLDVFIADYENRRIARCDNALHWITAYSFPDESERLRLGFPCAVAISLHADLFIADSENQRILKLNTQWAPELSFGDFDWGEGVLLEPVALTVARDDRVYVSDRRAGCISVYDYFGTWLYSWGEGVLKAPAGLCLDGRGVLWVSDSAHQRLFAFDPSGRLLLQYGGPGEKYGAFKHPVDVTVMHNRVYVVDSDNHRIQVFEIY